MKFSPKWLLLFLQYPECCLTHNRCLIKSISQDERDREKELKEAVHQSTNKNEGPPLKQEACAGNCGGGEGGGGGGAGEQ